MPEDVVFAMSGSLPSSRRGLVYSAVASALKDLGEANGSSFQIDTSFALPVESPGGAVLGLQRIKSSAKIVAAGAEAFRLWASYIKAALFLGDLPWTKEDNDLAQWHEIREIIWSSSNTHKVVALDKAAWSAIQLLPCTQHIFVPCPAISLPQINRTQPREAVALVINHHDRPEFAEELSRQLVNEFPLVETIGFSTSGATEVTESCLGEIRASIHFHVGGGNSRPDWYPLRIIDSWRSGCAVVQCCANESSAGAGDNPNGVQDGISGLSADTLETAVQAGESLKKDAALMRTLTSVGEAMVANAGSEWKKIAKELTQ